MKIVYLFLFSLTFLTPVISFSQDLMDGLIGYYPFSGNTGDSSGNANNGTNYGATLTADRFGNPDRAYAFNGTDNYISLPSSPFLVNTFTYSAWVKLNSLPASNDAARVISIGGTGGDQNLGIVNNYSAVSGWNFAGYETGGGNVPAYTSGSMPSTGTWYHILGTRDGSQLKFYLNGEYLGAVSATGTPFYGTSPAAIIGARSHSSMQYFNGAIDDVRIYDRALTACEISVLYNEEKKGDLISGLFNFSPSEDFTIYPNPSVNGSISIEGLSQADGQMDLTIINYLGEIVYQDKLEGKLSGIETRLNTPGIYILKIKSEKGEASKMFLITNH